MCQVVIQHSEEDCGAACLASISKHYGRTFTLNRIREAVGTGRNGTSLLGLKQGAEFLGFNARGVKASLFAMEKAPVPLPAIIHYQGYHWVVYCGRRGRKYAIGDPAVGMRYLDKKELTALGTDLAMLLLEPDPHRFFAQPDEAEQISGFSRFLRRLYPYRTLLIQVFVFNAILGVLSLISPFLLQLLTDNVLVRGDLQLLTSAAIAACVLYLLSSFLELAQSTLVTHFAQRFELGLVLEFVRHLLQLPLKYYESRRSGEVTSRLDDIQQINQLIAQVVIRLPSEFFIALVSLGLMLSYSLSLTAAALAIAFSMTLSTVVLLPKLQQKARSVLAKSGENQGLLVETFKGALTLKTSLAAPQLWEEFQGRFGHLARLSFQTVQIGTINGIFSRFVERGGSLALLWLGSQLVMHKQLTIGQLLAFYAMNGNFSAFIATLVDFVDEFAQAKAALQRLTELVAIAPETEQRRPKPTLTIPSDAEITCTKLNFHHAGGLKFFQDLSLTVPGGKVVALIGPSGCGKSTLAKLMASLYLPHSGNIRIGPYNLQDIALNCLRQQVVLVPQEPHFWSRSILENFRLSCPQVSFEPIVRACQIAQADGFISQLPDKYQTVLGEFGANLSGGQKQRLAIARAIVSQPPILILDESTGALDPDSEAQVLENLKAYRHGQTRMLISHRPRVIQQADWIILLTDGQLKLQGSYPDLVSRPGDHLAFLIP